jgi:hypothetical protein
LNGRVEKAVKLVLQGDVELHDDTTALVNSLSDPTRAYQLAQGVCQCRDWGQAPEHLCCHRLAAGFLRKVQALMCVAQTPDHEFNSTVETSESDVLAGKKTQPLYEAGASANVHVTIAGRDVLVTLRDHDEGRLLERLQALLARYPVAQPAPQAASQTPDGWCAVHQTTMQWNTGRAGRQGWWSHRMDDGWCKGK